MAGQHIKKKEEAHRLIERIKDGDREAFMKIVTLYQQRIFLLAYSFFHNREDALDIVQETFFRLHRKIHSFRSGENFQNWILQIARNLCIDHYRKYHKKKREWEVERKVDELRVKASSRHNSSAPSDLKDIITQCLNKLAERQRMIFVMRHFNGLKYREIAQVLNISLGTVKSLHFKAVQNLRGLLAPYLGREA
ncbi:MAG: RNA polymerase sigma factor [Candidatus Aminicenantales bacterium]